jgi:hypothetical protein
MVDGRRNLIGEELTPATPTALGILLVIFPFPSPYLRAGLTFAAPTALKSEGQPRAKARRAASYFANKPWLWL